MSSELEAYRTLYLTEAERQLKLVERCVRAFEAAPGQSEQVEAAFRAAHTLKAMSATMGYEDIAQAAHSLEDQLVLLRRERQVDSAPPLELRPVYGAITDLYQRLRRVQANALIQGSRTAPLPVVEGYEPSAALTSHVPVRQQDLNRLLELTAELAVSSNQLERAASEAAGAETDGVIRLQRELIRELRRLTWQLNMAPIGPVLERHTRLLHELARPQGKAVRVEIYGADVELCHAMLEALNEPLVHLLRNGVSHGIELPAQRAAAGKPVEGLITLRAARAGDRVRITVADDGRGMDAREILEAAYSRGLITREQYQSLTPAEALRLVLLPNFSMSPEVSTDSGRGIGMSVVAKRLGAVDGRIEIESTPGQGTKITLDVPRLVGLIEVELLRSGKQVCAVPTSQIAAARIWLPSEIAGRQKRAEDGQGDLRIYDVKTLRPANRSQLASPSGVCLVELQEPRGTALCADELLGKALLNYPFAVLPASIPILDPSALFST